MNTHSIVPIHYDLPFIIQMAGVENHYGYEAKGDGVHFRYRLDDFDDVMRVIANYPVEYRAVMVPKMLAELATMRDARIQSFSFMGMPVSLNDKTIANLTAATVGLERNPSVPSINWAINKDTFVALPRDVVLAMADAAFVHVQGCFNAQKAIAEEIMAAPSIDELRAMNLVEHEAWPA